jgi:hypothetical protein
MLTHEQRTRQQEERGKFSSEALHAIDLSDIDLVDAQGNETLWKASSNYTKAQRTNNRTGLMHIARERRISAVLAAHVYASYAYSGSTLLQGSLPEHHGEHLGAIRK